MSFDLSAYEPVADRLSRFWTDHPGGRVETDLAARDERGVVFVCRVWTDRAEPQPAATGWAHEVETARGVNATSYIENCETSAIGRALANLNYAPKSARPSREEMAKAARRTEDAGRAPVDRGGALKALYARAHEAGLSAVERRNRLWTAFGKEHLHQLSEAELRETWTLWGPAATSPAPTAPPDSSGDHSAASVPDPAD